MNNSRNMSIIAPDDVQEYIRSHPDTVILDIRTQREHMEQRIEGSLNQDFNELSSVSIARLLPDKNKTVMVCCRAGIHSKAAAAMLRRYGYRAIDIGSIHDWSGEFEGRLM